MESYRIYVVRMPDGTEVHVKGSDKNEAWSKLQFEGQMIDSLTPDEFASRFAGPTVVD